jgi:hypothetical protein
MWVWVCVQTTPTYTNIRAYTIDNKFVPRCHLFNRLVWFSYYQAFDSLYYQAITESSLKGEDQYNRPPCTN